MSTKLVFGGRLAQSLQEFFLRFGNNLPCGVGVLSGDRAFKFVLNFNQKILKLFGLFIGG